jgi:hypothetical protein
MRDRERKNARREQLLTHGKRGHTGGNTSLYASRRGKNHDRTTT